MSQNIKQIYDSSPATSMAATDLLYLGRSPYGVDDDFAITWANMQLSISQVGTIVTGAWHGTLVGTAYGGTGVASVTTSPTASSFAGWDANSNLSANNFISGYATTATAAATTTLLVGSAQLQYFTGSTTQTVKMPVTSTLALGQSWTFVNNSSGVVTVQSSGSNTIQAMAANTSMTVTCILTSGTTAASWNSNYSSDIAGVTSITGTANQVIASASTGDITLSLPQSIATTSDVTFNSLTTTASVTAGINLINGFATTATAAGTTTLTASSKGIQEFTGSTTQTVVFPVTSTLTAGQTYRIINNSSGNVTLQSSGANTILVMAANTEADVICVLTSGTTAASWNASYVYDAGAGVLSITGTANQVIASASTGDITLSLPQSIATTSDVTFGSVTFSPNTKGIVGTPTNDSAGTGYVGEYVTATKSFAAPVSLTSDTPADVISISLTAGDWDVWGVARFIGGATTVVSYLTSWISTTSATNPGRDLIVQIPFPGSGTAVFSADYSFAVAAYRLSLSGTTTVYLSSQSGFSVSTCTAFGLIQARRRR